MTLAGQQLISVDTKAVVHAVRGHRQLDSVVIENGETGELAEIATHHLFVMIGAEPHTDWLVRTLKRDRYGYILTGDDIPRRRLPMRAGLRSAGRLTC